MDTQCAGNCVPAFRELETVTGADKTGNMAESAHEALKLLNEFVSAEAKLP
jgi:hypothetical protein